MDELYDAETSKGLEGFCQDGTCYDMSLSGKVDVPLGDDFFDCHGEESCQAEVPGGLPSPNSSNPDLPGSCRQSPLLPSVSTFSGVCDLQALDANLHHFISHLPQQSQESCANMDSNISNSYPCSNPDFSNGNNNSPQAYRQQGEPSMGSSNFPDAGPYQTFTVPTEGSLCASENLFQDFAATRQSNEPIYETAPIGGATSTQVSNALNNTFSASAAANSQHSLPLSSQHFVRNPSPLQNQIHPELQQDSPFVNSEFGSFASQAPNAMSSSHRFVNHQGPNASPSHSNHQSVQHSSIRPPYRRIVSVHNQSRGSPVSQNHQPFHLSNLRTSVTPSSLQDNPWEAGQFGQETKHPDLQSISRQQSNRLPYMGHHYVSRLEGNPLIGYSPEQYRIQSSDSPDMSFIGQGPTHFDFNGSSPLDVKREISSSDSDYVATTSNPRSQTASPKPQKKRRVKQESRNNNDKEVAVNPIALQTADLTNMSPTDHQNVTALINAMHNTENVEDNDGMKKTWEKVRKAKALRIREVCVELLVSLAF